jgi:hypothetical protein
MTSAPETTTALRRARWAGAFLLAAGVAAIGIFLATGPFSPGPVGAVIRAVPLVLAVVGIGWAVAAVLAAKRPLHRAVSALLAVGVCIALVALVLGSVLFSGLLGGLFILAVPAALIFVAAQPPDPGAPVPGIGSRLGIAAALGALVLAVVVLGFVHIAVWNPVAKVPGLDLAEIYRALEAAGETPMWAFPIAWAAFWSLAALGLPVLAVATRRMAWMSNRRIIVTGLLLVGGAAITLWMAGFNHGMSIADTFMTSGGDAAASGPLILALGTAAVIIAIFIAVPPRGAVVDRT